MQNNGKVLKSTIDRAYDRWNRYFGLNEYHMFWRFLEAAPHSPYARDARWPHIYLNPRSMQKLDMLLGIHHIAIIKAYRAKTLPRKSKNGNKDRRTAKSL